MQLSTLCTDSRELTSLQHGDPSCSKTGAGEAIVSLAAGWDHLLACVQSGSVHASGWSANGQAEGYCRTDDTQPQMVAVSAGEQHR